MTIKYTLTRTELVRSYLQSMAGSARFRRTILIYSAAVGVFSLVVRGVLYRAVTSRDILAALAWMAGVFVFMPLWLFLRGKTAKRTLTVSAEGISTQIGSHKGDIPWSNVKVVADVSRHVLIIVGATGNAFLIPNRAFQGPDQRAQFLTQIDSWRT